jgi:hypothetical protein
MAQDAARPHRGAADAAPHALEPVGLLEPALSRDIADRGITVSPNKPRQLSAVPATLHHSDEAVPAPKPAVTSAMALARSLLRVSSAAITPLIALVAASSARPRATTPRTT